MRQLEVYREAAARAGRPPRPVLRRDIYVGETDDEARAVVGAILAEGYRGTGFDQLVVGSADTVIGQLARYRDMGFDYVMVRHIVGDHRLMLRSFERIGRDVMPRIRGALSELPPLPSRERAGVRVATRDVRSAPHPHPLPRGERGAIASAHDFGLGGSPLIPASTSNTTAKSCSPTPSAGPRSSWTG